MRAWSALGTSARRARRASVVLVVAAVATSTWWGGAAAARDAADEAADSGYIAGRVTGPDGDPVRVSIRAYPVGRTTMAGRQFTSSDGRYRLGPLPAGGYHVLFESDYPETTWAWQWYGNAARRFDSGVVPVPATAGSTVDARMERGGVIAGRVIAADGRPIGTPPVEAYVTPRLFVDVRAVSVDLARDLGSAAPPTHVDGGDYLWVDKDKYFLRGLQSGDYRIQVVPSLPDYPAEWLVDEAGETSADPVEAVVAATTRAPVATVAPQGRHLWPLTAPEWSGKPRVGETLTLRRATWNNRPDSYRFTWSWVADREVRQRVGKRVELTKKMQGYDLRACVTARRDGWRKSRACVFTPSVRPAR